MTSGAPCIPGTLFVLCNATECESNKSNARHIAWEERTELSKSLWRTADVKACAATLHPDEYVAQEVRKAKIKATVDSLENLSEQWNSRCRTLQAMLSKLRG